MSKKKKTAKKTEKRVKKVYNVYSRIIDGKKYVVKATNLKKATKKFNKILNKKNDE